MKEIQILMEYLDEERSHPLLSRLPQYVEKVLNIAGVGNEVVLCGRAPIWLYLAVLQELQNVANSVIYSSAETGNLVIFDRLRPVWWKEAKTAGKLNRLIQDLGYKAVDLNKELSKVMLFVILQEIKEKGLISPDEYLQYMHGINEFQDPWEKKTGYKISVEMLDMLWNRLKTI